MGAWAQRQLPGTYSIHGHPSLGPRRGSWRGVAPGLSISLTDQPPALAAWAAGSLRSTQDKGGHLSPRPEAARSLSARSGIQSSIAPSPALQAIAWVPRVPPAALPPLPKSQHINPTSHTELLGCVSHHPVRDASPRRGCHHCHQPPSPGMARGSRTPSAGGEPGCRGRVD